MELWSERGRVLDRIIMIISRDRYFFNMRTKDGSEDAGADKYILLNTYWYKHNTHNNHIRNSNCSSSAAARRTSRGSHCAPCPPWWRPSPGCKWQHNIPYTLHLTPPHLRLMSPRSSLERMCSLSSRNVSSTPTPCLDEVSVKELCYSDRIH